MTKTDERPDTKRALLEAAVSELADKGWGGLRTRNVANRAAVNKGLVHYHFDSMDDLRYEAVAMVLGEAANESATTLLAADTLANGLREFTSFLHHFRRDDPAGVVLMEAMLYVPRDPRLEAMLLRTLDIYEAALRERIGAAAESGELPSDIDEAGLATALTAALDGLVLHAYIRTNTDFTAAGEALAHVVEHASTR